MSCRTLAADLIGEAVEALEDRLVGGLGRGGRSGREAGGVRVVALEGDVVGVEVDHPVDGVLLEPEAAVHLAPEVEARQLHLGISLGCAGVVPLPVEGLDVVGDPPEAALHQHEVQVGVLVAHPEEGQIGEGLGVAEVRHGAELRVVGAGGLFAQHALEVVLVELLEPDVEVERHPGLLGHREERLPMGVVQGRKPDLVRLGQEADAVVALLAAAQQFGDARLDVPVGQYRQQHEAPRIDAGEVGQEIVVSPDGLHDQIVVAHGPEGVPGEGEQVRVEGLGPDSEVVHAGQPGRRVPRAGLGLLKRPRVRRRRLVPAGGRPVGDTGKALPADQPAHLISSLVEKEVRDPVSPLLLRHARRPQIGRLHHVAVGVDDPDIGECHGVGILLSDCRGDGREAQPGRTRPNF